MKLKLLQLPDLYPSYDERASAAHGISSVVVQPILTTEPIRYGGTNYWVPDDPRPTKAEAKKKVDDFVKARDRAVEFFTEDLDIIGVDPEPIVSNIPWWVWTPFYVAPYVADELIELDPLDRLED